MSTEAARTAAREERFRALIEHSAEVIAVLDAKGWILYASPAVERVLGYAPEDLVGEPASALVHPDDLKACRALFTRAVREPEFVITALTVRVRRKDGSWGVLEATGRSALENPAVGGVVLNARDVTTRHALEARLREAEKLESVGLLAGGIAHDFNNLLTVVRANAELLLEIDVVAAAAGAELEEIRTAADRAAVLTRHLLAFARRQVLRPQVVDVSAVVAALEPLLRRMVGAHVTRATALDPAAGRVEIDASQLEQVVTNLALNARDAMPAGGELRLATARRAVDPAAAALALPPGDYVLLTIGDTGHGMDEATRARVFEPFFTTKPSGQGTGLGLATVHGIVTQSGGQIRVESAPGRGTTFLVFLPAARRNAAPETPGATVPPAATAPPGVAVPDARGGGRVILVVDDEPAVRGVAARALTRLGYTVLTAPDADHALGVLRDHPGPIDLLLTDHVMPGLSGRELIVRAHALRPDLPAALMSGYSSVPSGAPVAEAEGLPFLAKPFAVDTLTALVARLVPAAP